MTQAPIPAGGAVEAGEDPRKVITDLWLRCMLDSRTADGRGGLLPSEAARIVSAITGCAPVEVLLAVGGQHFIAPDIAVLRAAQRTSTAARALPLTSPETRT